MAADDGFAARASVLDFPYHIAPRRAARFYHLQRTILSAGSPHIGTGIRLRTPIDTERGACTRVALRTNAAKDIALKPGERGIGVTAGAYATATAASTAATARQIAVLVEPLAAARPTAN